MIAHHFTCRAIPGQRLFRTRDEARDLWARMESAFPRAIASSLMPTHLHLLDPESASFLKHRMSCILSAWRRRHGIPALEIPLPNPSPIPDKKHLLRQIRYVHLNPCRDRLARDPLEWEWSTHRDWVGAIARPWPDVDSWSKVLGYPRNEAAERIHSYVSADPTVAVSGTPVPKILSGSLEKGTFGPLRILSAVPLVLRGNNRVSNFGRSERMFAASAIRSMTSASLSEIAGILGMSKAGVHGAIAAHALTPAERTSLLLTLDDPRLFRALGPYPPPR